MSALAARSPVVLLYHGVPQRGDGTSIDAAVFERHIVFLKRHCDFVTPENVRLRRKALDRIQVLLTFDDGMQNNAAVVAPILRRYGVPAVFLVCSRHASPGKYLWFTYLHALERHFAGSGFRFRGDLIDMTRAQRRASVRRLSEVLLSLKPHPAAMYQAIDEELPRLEDFVSPHVITDAYAGMTADQVGELAACPLFAVGIHTVDHPFLTKCSAQDMRQQIEQNRIWLENTARRPCRIIAYPGGEYNAEVIECSKNLGMAYGYAVIPKMDGGSVYEIPRLGIYARSLEILGVKAYLGRWMRRLKLKVG
jgi:peptidoglycan/xylan/chitin deacetylase (PgdA/CDA1 family)